MHAFHMGQRRDRPVRKLLKKFRIFLSEPLLGPDSGKTGNRVESIQADEAGACLVMIAANKCFSQLAHAGCHLVGICAVADYIAQIEHQVVFGRGPKTRFQSFKVGMNIR